MIIIKQLANLISFTRSQEPYVNRGRKTLGNILKEEVSIFRGSPTVEKENFGSVY